MKASRIVLGCILASLGFLAGGAGAQIITEFSAGITGGEQTNDITAGPDGNLWFTGLHHPLCGSVCGGRATCGGSGRITPGGVVTEFSVGISVGAVALAITAGADGNLWFVEGVSRIGRITPLGVVTEFNAGI